MGIGSRSRDVVVVAREWLAAAAHTGGGCDNVGASAAKDVGLFRQARTVRQWRLQKHDNLEKMMRDSNRRVQRWTTTSMTVLALSMATCGAQTVADEGRRRLFWVE
ncbi:hypothetical protein DEO72_LG10g2607 [Vigna unguiculata]|uniref:Uncharacterized protein n=1 Tax=Vigna unguiculata TaxID=3917 RepID=A0A4D6NF85_VIGUN|nr:hypothetical protein DEO72_LG10g2607 [Vigna unguiculata]